MGNGLLFRWEDSQALRHHCGLCERPLSHPGARASCFGKHSEPCIRFHQAMFMRLRAHTCAYCLSIEEAHYKRHTDIAEQLRGVYESCEVDWSIIPSETEDRARAREPDDRSADNRETDRSLTPEETPSSKRERKDAKRLTRAASRSKVTTQEEIRYVDSVLHSVEGISSTDSDGPRNPEEIEEIERHLRYNAHVYNTQPDGRRSLKRFAQLPDADVDFGAEMERILDIFRISELVKRNTRNRGLQGRELKTFQTLVDEFKKAVVEDIVLVKKDILEIRMRRAGYLRYTNKTAYDIVEDRYTDKDWKTGEKFASSSSDSSGVITPVEEINALDSKQEENALPQPLPSTHGPDRRHLENIHTRVSGDDGLHEAVIEPYRAPLLPMLPDLTPMKKPVSLKVVGIRAPDQGLGNVRRGHGRKNTQQQGPDGWQTITNGKKPTVAMVKPAWAASSAVARPGASRPSSNLWTSIASELPGLSSSTQNQDSEAKINSPAVQAPEVTAVSASHEPEQFLTESVGPVDEATNGHPAVSQRKKTKKAREAKRKAKKLTTQEVEETMNQDDVPGDAMDDLNTVSANSLSTTDTDVDDMVVGRNDVPPTIKSLRDTEVEPIASVTETVTQMERPDAIATPTPLPVTKNTKHMHWTKFKRNFIVDQLTDPFLPSWTGCSHGTSCAFESNGVPDCPFHEPHCACVDPLSDMCYLVYPCGAVCSSGPYNRLRGEKLMAMYEKDSRTKGRLMLVDDDLVHYFMEDPSSRHRNRDPGAVPKRLAEEYADFADGYNPGPLMEQERQFERLWNKNKVMKHQITRRMLQDIQRQNFERPGVGYMCYCLDTIPVGGVPEDIIMCSHRNCDLIYFHKSCVKKLGIEKVSRWFCTSCEKEMKVLARQTLRDLGYTDIPDEVDFEASFDQKLKDMLDMPMPDGMMSKLKERFREFGRGSVDGADTMAFEMD